jgi:hypothetical protein
MRCPAPGATVLKVAVLLVIIVASFTKADPANLRPFTQPPDPKTADGGAAGIFQAMAISFYSYAGFDALTNAAEEVGAQSSVVRLAGRLAGWEDRPRVIGTRLACAALLAFQLSRPVPRSAGRCAFGMQPLPGLYASPCLRTRVPLPHCFGGENRGALENAAVPAARASLMRRPRTRPSCLWPSGAL